MQRMYIKPNPYTAESKVGSLLHRFHELVRGSIYAADALYCIKGSFRKQTGRERQNSSTPNTKLSVYK